MVNSFNLKKNGVEFSLLNLVFYFLTNVNDFKTLVLFNFNFSITSTKCLATSAIYKFKIKQKKSTEKVKPQEG